jgi:hypothetical protein
MVFSCEGHLNIPVPAPKASQKETGKEALTKERRIQPDVSERHEEDTLPALACPSQRIHRSWWESGQ